SVELLTLAADPAVSVEAAATALARLFQRHGVAVRGRRVAGLDDGEAERALRQAIDAGGLVVCLADDEAAAAVRRALAHLVGSRLVLSDQLMEALAAAHARHGRAMPRRAEALALVPHGATPLVPPDGGEPGVLVEAGATPVAVLPNDPRAARALAEAHLLVRLPRRAAEPVTQVRTLRLVGLDRADAEAAVAGVLRGVEGASARVVEADDEVWVRLALRGPTSAAAERRLADLEPALRQALGRAWYGVDDESLPVVVGGLLRARGLTVALAESCTGGLIAHRLTDVAGSSAYLERGLVVYSNAAKQTLLGIPEALLARHGAVSAECADAMARGVRAQARTDLGLSVTGIAGPDGGTPTKPVGLVFLALADARAVTVERHRFRRDRAGNKALAALAGLDLLRRYCLDAGR
ncbi:MAG TPA: nicotinamide-nucleotide amidohydrolase family protein, partial [Solirubrobacteraceae bacterium]|nr:nicotinamide-nucleotide amidohydrolase family protein [Solirubrobacteraceae bacterium]